ncbi:hypothetical protein B0I35DRAFT_472497 [Stachybotrys elegans]|uniref:F-box domain-containing protein n=1 Tax=Stachybotrys elegans TaxID=80388 RepID=A0A8K0SX39_9HYPO|nr:hypothetical protein B0I35DRAFT_472497 [Stachybotrys elegans]
MSHSPPGVISFSDTVLDLDLSVSGSGSGGAPDHLRTLPNEIWIAIFRHLDFGDLEALRRTCRYYHATLTPRLVRFLLGPEQMSRVLTWSCRNCGRYDPDAKTLAWPESLRNLLWQPYEARCIDCLYRHGLLLPNAHFIGKFSGDWKWCRWCGRLHRRNSSLASYEARHCNTSYDKALGLNAWFALGRWIIAVTAYAVALAFVPDTLPVALSGALTLCFMCGSLLTERYDQKIPPSDVSPLPVRAAMQAILLGLAVPPVYYGTRRITLPGWNRGLVAALCLCYLHTILRLANLVGLAFICFGYNFRRANGLKSPPLRVRVINPIAGFFIISSWVLALDSEPMGYHGHRTTLRKFMSDGVKYAVGISAYYREATPKAARSVYEFVVSDILHDWLWEKMILQRGR